MKELLVEIAVGLLVIMIWAVMYVVGWGIVIGMIALIVLGILKVAGVALPFAL